MQQSSLAKWLKIIVIGVGICLTILCMWVIPNLGDSFQMQYPEYSCAFYPWLIFIWLSSIPCYIVLVFAWKIFTNIGKDESFTALNANYLKWISILAEVDSFFFFMSLSFFPTWCLWRFNAPHPSSTKIEVSLSFIVQCSSKSNVHQLRIDLES